MKPEKATRGEGNATVDADPYRFHFLQHGSGKRSHGEFVRVESDWEVEIRNVNRCEEYFYRPWRSSR